SLWLEIPKDARTANRNSNRLRTLFYLAFCSLSTYNGSKKPQPDSTDFKSQISVVGQFENNA
ncbi:MAG: hypothetical protein NTV86_04810, partial [Planctomycetota bacterium]|nr:hypothetical protein [Planctomycetota bacterium]